MKRLLVVTGVGSITPYGEATRRYWENLKAGCSAIRILRLFDPPLVTSRVAAQVLDGAPGKIVPQKDFKGLPRVRIKAIGSAREALSDVGSLCCSEFASLVRRKKALEPEESSARHLARARQRGANRTARIRAHGGRACSQAWLTIWDRKCPQSIGQS